MWRLRLDTLGGWLALELRDADLLQAQFYTLRLPAGLPAPLHIPDQSTWWLGLEEAHAGQLYLHGYGERKLGQHLGVRAFSAETGDLIWQQPVLALYGIAATGLLAYDPIQLSGELLLLDSSTGETLQSGIPQHQASGWVKGYLAARQQGVQYPQLYLAGEDYFEQVQNFLSQALGCEAVSAIEYAETETCFVMSYYIRKDADKLDNFLAVFDLNGFLHLNQLLVGAIDGVGSDTFFIFMRKLYFVQNKATVTAYSL